MEDREKKIEKGMDLLTSIFDEIKSRFGNRLVINVIIYWLLFNWKITVALFWYDTTQIEAEGCRSTFEFISDQLENNSHWCQVLFSAILSTLLLPIVKMCILAFDARIRVERTNRISRINKDELSQQNIKLKSIISNVNDSSFLNGKWKYQRIIKNQRDKEVLKTSNTYKIENGMITVIHDGENELDKYIITDFWFLNLPNEGKLHMKMVLMSNYENDETKKNILEKEFLSFLTIEKDNNGRIVMKGYQNNDYVEYLKLD